MGARVMALQEQAEGLGYSTIQDAIDDGYEVAYKASGNHELYKPDEQELAHRAWEKEKQVVMGDLMNLMVNGVFDFDIIERAYHFIGDIKHE